MEIYLVRHTTPDIEKGICYGQSDIALTKDFAREAENVVSQLPEKLDAIYTSPLSRCGQLTNFITTYIDAPVKVDPRLMELNFGAWEMQTWKSLESPALNDWMNDYVNVRCHEGESYKDLVNRTAAFTNELKKQHHQSAAIVTHHGVMKAFHAIVEKISLEEAMGKQFGYGSVVRVVVD